MKSKKHILLWGYGVLLHAVVIAALFFPKFIDDQRWRFGSLGDDRQQVFAEELHHYHLAKATAMKPGRVILLGDSQIHRMDANLLKTPSLNFGIGGDVLPNMKARMQSYHALGAARALVVWGGVNDLRDHAPAEVAADMEEFIKAMPNSLDVLVLSLAPVRTGAQKYVSNDAIVLLNEKTAALCTGACQYLDVHGSLVDETGGLAAAFDAGDGLHLNATGYAVVTDLINKALK